MTEVREAKAIGNCALCHGTIAQSAITVGKAPVLFHHACYEVAERRLRAFLKWLDNRAQRKGWRFYEQCFDWYSDSHTRGATDARQLAYRWLLEEYPEDVVLRNINRIKLALDTLEAQAKEEATNE